VPLIGFGNAEGFRARPAVSLVDYVTGACVALRYQVGPSARDIRRPGRLAPHGFSPRGLRRLAVLGRPWATPVGAGNLERDAAVRERFALL
jgi:hypothetical protein